MTVDRGRLVTYAQRWLGQDSEDAVQEALLRVWERYRDPALLDHVGMVRRTLYHVVVDEVRKRRRRPRVVRLPEWLPHHLDVEHETVVVDELESAVLALERAASPRFPAAELLLVALGWSVQELARSAGVPRATVKTALFRQRALLWKEVRRR
jgi:DNA-directed RNA polymerase specialized sigma24 family protein